MSPKLLIASLAFTLTVAPLTSYASTIAPATEAATPLGKASGSGTLVKRIFSKDPSASPEKMDVNFQPKCSYAYSALDNGQRTLWIVVADQSLDSATLDAADNRQNSLKGWCKKQHAGFVAMQLDSHDKPMYLLKCVDGQMSSAGLSEESTGGDRGKVEFTLNDGGKIAGSMVSGVGSSRMGDVESIDEVNGDYRFATDLAPPTMRDLVLSVGDSNDPVLVDAKATFLKYWSAARGAKSLDAVNSWFTPERKSEVAAQTIAFVEFGGSPDRLVTMFSKSHTGTPTITGAAAVGSTAVITSVTDSDGKKQTCQTLLLLSQDAWKVGNEVCKLN